MYRRGHRRRRPDKRRLDDEDRPAAHPGRGAAARRRSRTGGDDGRPVATTDAPAAAPAMMTGTSWDGCNADDAQWQRRAPRHHATTTTATSDGPGAPPGPPAPFPALINLTVPAGTILGWSAAPGEAGGWGLPTPATPAAWSRPPPCIPAPAGASPSSRPTAPRSRTAAPAAPHPWIPPPGDGQRNRDGPDARQAAALAGLLQRPQRHLHPHHQGHLRPRQRRRPLRPQQETQAPGSCAYRDLPGAGLRRAGLHYDLDHTLAYPAGITCQCDLAPPCRRHHRVKQAPAGRSPSPSPASCAGRRPPGAATPPDPPSTTPRDPRGRLRP